MLFPKRGAGLVCLAVLLTSLTACANSPTGKSLEQILAADPRLKQNPVTLEPSSDPNRQTKAALQLPPDFPAVIPLYPNAQLQEVTQPTSLATGGGNSAIVGSAQTARWSSSDPSNLIQNFYQNQFQANNWEILSKPADEQGGTFEVRRNDLQVTVTIQPLNASSTPPTLPPAGQNPQVGTEFVIQYLRKTKETPGHTATEASVPQPGSPNFIGPLLPSGLATQPDSTPSDKPLAASGNEVFTDLNKAPQELRQYIQDLAALGVLSLEPSTGSKSTDSSTTNLFEPSKIISRREYARWLVAANNSLHANTPAQQIRGASPTSQRAFQDVPPQDPDFSTIQGLAEAGLIPSPLSGDSTAVLFRPDAPLTREQLILWKVPLDTRAALPNASPDAVKQTWGFQDAARIDPKALRAVLADFQNSEQSNIRRVFGYTTLFQPKKPVTRAEAAAALWYFGTSSEGISAQEALQLKRQQSQPSPTSEPTPSSSASP